MSSVKFFFEIAKGLIWVLVGMFIFLIFDGWAMSNCYKRNFEEMVRQQSTPALPCTIEGPLCYRSE